MHRMFKASLRFMPVRHIPVQDFLLCMTSSASGSSSYVQTHKLLNIDTRTSTTNKRRTYEIISKKADDPVGNEDANLLKKGYVEIWRTPRKRKQAFSTKTLSHMQKDIHKLAKTLYRLRANEKGQIQRTSQVAGDEQKFEEKGVFSLSSNVDSPVESISFTVRTPDRRVLIKKFTGITVSRVILQMLRDRKVRINEVVTYDFAIVCKPMDMLDIWKGELEDNPAFARIDRFQILDVIRSSCCQYFTVHAVILRDILVENWFPWEIPKISNY